MAQGHEQPTPEPTGQTASEPNPDATSTPSAAAVATDQTPGAESKKAQGVPVRSYRDHVLTAVLALAFGMLGSFVFFHFRERAPRPTETTVTDQTDGPEYRGPSTQDLNDRLAKVSDRVDGMNHRIDALPKPEPPPDLSDLQVQVADLTRSTEAIAPLREAVKRIDGRLEDLSQSIRSLGGEVHAQATHSGTIRTTSTGSRRPEGNEDVNLYTVTEPVTAEALGHGAELFKQHHYQEALDYFTKLEQKYPDDARVWYYAALAHGFATRQWNADGTERLVTKGLECERAGTPLGALIDNTFKDLTSATGKDWLAGYRKRVAPNPP